MTNEIRQAEGRIEEKQTGMLNFLLDIKYRY